MTKIIKGLSPDEWTAAAIGSLTDEALTQMIQAVAMIFKSLKDEAIRRGRWDELKGQRPG